MSKNSEESQIERQDTARRLFLKKEPITLQGEGVRRKFGPSVERRHPKPKPKPKPKPRPRKKSKKTSLDLSSSADRRGRRAFLEA